MRETRSCPQLSFSSFQLRNRKNLEESEERYRLIAQNSEDVIWLYDLNADGFSYVSPSIERLRGFTPDEMVGQHLLDSLNEESRPMIELLLKQRLAAFVAGDPTASCMRPESDRLCKSSESE